MTIDPSKKLSTYGIVLADVNRITYAGDTAALREWFRNGVPLDVSNENSLLFQFFVSRGSTKMATEMLLAGVDPDITNTWNTSPAIFNAVRHGKLDALRMLVWAGADVMVGRDSTGTLLHEAVGKSATKNHEIVERLVVEGVPLKTQCNERTAEQKARGSNIVIARKMRAYMKLEEAIEDKSLDKERLIYPFEDKQASLPQSWAPMRWIESNVCWAWMDRILPILEAKGETITRKDLMVAPRYLAWAVVGGALDALDAHLQAQGESITMDDFLKPDGTAALALDVVLNEWGEKRLLDSEWVKGQSTHNFRRLLNAMPESKLDRMRNHHQLIVRHERQLRSASLEGGLVA